MFDFLLSWKIFALFGLQIFADVFNCYLAVRREFKGRGASPVHIVPIFFTLMQIAPLKFHHPALISYAEIFIVIILSPMLHFGMAFVLPGLLKKFFGIFISR